ncbi:hypothetical protein, partial [Clostridioides difficile]|uniref:hypothetical protein n=1 Tax=Clostridioides difficile TaxID=1496 RepID=UPI00211580C7
FHSSYDSEWFWALLAYRIDWSVLIALLPLVVMPDSFWFVFTAPGVHLNLKKKLKRGHFIFP